MNKKDFQALVSSMPPLRHSIEGQSFNENDSDVVKWLLEQPGIRSFLFHRATGTGRMKYDPETKKWAGVLPTRGPGRPSAIEEGEEWEAVS